MKLNCYIVEDLMPSYIENLTNENTSKDIQEHFIECERCKKLYSDMKQEILLPKNLQMDNEEKNKSDLKYLGKIRKNCDRKSVISLIVFVCITALLLMIAWNNIGNIHTSVKLSYVVLPLVILTGGFLCYRRFEKSRQRNWDLWLGQILVLTTAIIVILIMYLSYSWVNNHTYPLGLQAYEIGPFVARFLYIGIGIGAVVFFYGALQILKKSFAYYFLCSHSISLICMSIGFYRILKTLSSIEGYTLLCLQTGIVYWIGFVITIILWCILKNKRL